MNIHYRVLLATVLACSASLANAVATPTNFNADPTVNDGSYTLSWDEVTTDPDGQPIQNPVTHYNIMGTADNGTTSTKTTSNLSYASGSFPSAFEAYGSHTFTLEACNVDACSEEPAGPLTVIVKPILSGSDSVNTSTGSTTVNANYSVSWASKFARPNFVLVERHGNEGWKAVSNDASSITRNQRDSGYYYYKLVNQSLINVSGTPVPIYTSESTTNSVVVRPVAPTGVSLAATGNPGEVEVSWSANQDQAFDKYIIQKKFPGESGFVWGATKTVSGGSHPTSHVFSNLSPGSHEFRVRTRSSQPNNGGSSHLYSSLSSTVSVFVPAPPSISVPTLDEDGDIAVSWDNEGGVTYYVEEQSLDGGWEILGNTTDGTYARNGLVDGVYKYRVRGCSQQGICTGWVEATNDVVINTPEPYFREPGGDPLPATDGDPVYKGVLRGQFSALADGSANYQIPLQIPPGINGLKPNISLNYNSNGANGRLGIGWSIGGLSKIHRCKADLYRDGYRSSINFGDDFKYCIDGKRLVKVGNNEYRTEKEAYAKIVAYGLLGNSPRYWKVYKKDGSIMTYGNGNSSAEQEQGRPDAIAWHVRKVEDLASNYMTFHYAKNRSSGIFRIDRIEYTKNPNSYDTKHEVKFIYSTNNRPDIQKKYVAGSISRINKRLVEVRITSNGARSGSYHIDYQNYGENYFGAVYKDPTRASRIEKITHCFNNANDCSEPLVLKWSDATDADFSLNEANGFNGVINTTGDFDGDGREQWLTYELVNDQPSWSMIDPVSLDAQPVSLTDDLRVADAVDIDADGRLDFPKYTSDYHDDADFLRYTGNGYVATDYSTVGISTLPDEHTIFTDINGDGLVDLIDGLHGQGISSPDIEVTLNSTNGFHSRESWYSGDTLEMRRVDTPNGSKRVTPLLADFNGDGALDLYQCVPQSSGECRAKVMLNRNTEFSASQDWGVVGNTYMYVRENLGDLNGDGKTDRFAFTSNGLVVNLSSGTAFSGDQVWSSQLTSHVELGVYAKIHYRYNGNEVIPNSIMAAHFNDDACADIFFVTREYSSASGPKNTKAFVAYSNCANGVSEIRQLAAVYPSSGESGFIVRDLNSDGFMDLVKAEGGNALYYFGISYVEGKHYINNTGKHQVLSFLSGQHEIDVNFETILEDTVYSDDDSELELDYAEDDGDARLDYFDGENRIVSTSDESASIIIRTPSPLHVVSHYSVPTGPNTRKMSTYKYYNYKRNPAGLGSLGFSKVERTDNIAGSYSVKKTITNYTQIVDSEYSLVGYPIKKVIKATDTDDWVLRKLSETDYRWQVRKWSDDTDPFHDSPHYFPFLHSSISSHWNLDGSYTHDEVMQNFLDFTVDCDVPAPDSLDTTTASIHDDHGNKQYSQTVRCDQFGITGEGVNNIAFNDIDDSDRRVYGLVTEKSTIAWKSDSGGELESQTLNTEFTYYRNGANKGIVNSKTVAADNDPLKTVTTYGYNAYGTKSSVRVEWPSQGNDGLDFSATYIETSIDESFSSNGERTVISTNSKNQTETVVYEGRYGKVKQRFDINNLEVSTSYDNYGRPKQTVRSDGTSTSYSYLHCTGCSGYGYLPASNYYITEKSTGSAPIKTHYDFLGREVFSNSVDFNGNTVTAVKYYDGWGRVKDKGRVGTGVDSWTSYTYDILGRKRQVTRPDLSTTTFVYTGLKTTTNRSGIVSSQWHNSADQIKISKDPQGTQVEYQYDPFGNLEKTEVVPGDGSSPVTTTMDHDVLGRKLWVDDPNTGRWSYTYNALGQIYRQEDAKGVVTQYSYDRLGRMTERIWDADASGSAARTATWHYDTAAGKGKGQLASLTGFDTQGRSYQKIIDYTDYGLISRVRTTIDGNTYTERYYHDDFNRLLGHELPGENLVVANTYNEYGYLKTRYNALEPITSNKTIWEGIEGDAWGNITTDKLGAGINRATTYQPDTGHIDSILSLSSNGTVIQHHEYHFDERGNLEWRRDNSAGGSSGAVTQFFCYDALDRLEESGFGGCGETSYSYDALGNLTAKGDEVTYTAYEADQPNAVSQATVNGVQLNYLYDDNGQLTNRGGDTVQYSDFGKPTLMTGNGSQTEIVYGPDEARIQRIDEASKTTTYVGRGYEWVEEAGDVIERYYVAGAAVYTVRNGGEGEWLYLHRDHIGSVVASSSGDPQNASEIDRQAFDPWGKALSDDWAGPERAGPEPTERGFTDHEHLSNVGLVHMNGRVYDPLIARFVSPDPLIQAPHNTQSYNRYSYVWNNPLRNMDPSGYEVNSGVPCAALGKECDYDEETVVTGSNVGDQFDSMSLVDVASFVSNFRGAPIIVNEAAFVPDIIGRQERNPWLDDCPPGGSCFEGGLLDFLSSSFSSPGGVSSLDIDFSGVFEQNLDAQEGGSSGRVSSFVGFTALAASQTDAGVGWTTKSRQFRLYLKKFYGNQYTKVLQIAEAGKTVGYFGFAWGSASDLDARFVKGAMGNQEFFKNTTINVLSVLPPTALGGVSLQLNEAWGSTIYGGAIEALINGQSEGINSAMGSY